MTTSHNVSVTWHPSPSQPSPDSIPSNPNTNSLNVTQGRTSLTNQYLSCTLCYFQNAGILTKCEHRVVCLTCAENYVINQIKQGKPPKCLFQSCKVSSIDEEGLFKRFKQETKTKFKAQKLKLLLKKQKLLRNCQIPNCAGYVDQVTKNCLTCQSSHCSNCYRPSHVGKCLITQQFVQSTDVKKCKICNLRAFKQRGSSKLICPSCAKQICYKCGEQRSLQHHNCEEEAGWSKFPWNIFKQCCTSSSITAEKNSEIIM